MLKKTITSFFFILFCSYIPYIQAQNTRNNIQNFLATPAFKHASIGISIKDLSGKTIASHNENASLTTASILKVITTATVLEQFGDDFKLKTTLAKNSDNPKQLIIHGYGDPTLGSSSEYAGIDAQLFISQWKDKIIENFKGESAIDLMIIDNYFGYEGVSQKWLREDIGNYFAGGSYGISIFDNAYKIELNTMRTEALPTIVATVPTMENITFINTLGYNYSGKDSAYIVGDPNLNIRTLIGSVPAKRTSFSIKGAIPDPSICLANTLTEALQSSGLRVGKLSTSKSDFFDKLPTKKTSNIRESIFHTHLSSAMKDIVKEINVKSNNHYAEHLIRVLGREKNKNIYAPALDNGTMFVSDFWKTKGLNTDALFMYDGSGLAPVNAVSAAFMTDVLLYMQNKSSNAQAFLHSLPVAGKEGTVRFFLKGTRLAGKVFVKSGSIANVRCYAGYYIDGDNKYAFTIMVNKYNGSHTQVVKAIENLLLNLF